MFLSDPSKGLCGGFPFAAFHGLKAPLDAGDCLGTVNRVEHGLVSGSILNNQSRLAVDGQNDRPAGLLQLLDVRFGVALKIGQ